jgi:hypothetical protein
MIPANGAPHDLETRDVLRTLPFAQRRALRLAPGYLLPPSPSVAAPDQRREAVAKLNEKPLLALTVRIAIQLCSLILVVREGLEPSTSAL